MEAGKICLTILLPENNETMLPFLLRIPWLRLKSITCNLKIRRVHRGVTNTILRKIYQNNPLT